MVWRDVHSSALPVSSWDAVQLPLVIQDKLCFILPSGLQDRWQNVKSKLSSGVSFGHIKKHVKDFDVSTPSRAVVVASC